ncbi:hypothetical protein Q4S45_21505 [Massilia sp. R2A-15]|uniref:hypothetical protein n=1 Tax=Massilia sp. R2A-15 TaxID=3064278 RepID=UPI00273324A4|nr:hypothetical protein [Massilia sp. R2A-15]WLI89241.1 hypothetical protein Q4S45_21505 [Massilia sp. R2A-15]
MICSTLRTVSCDLQPWPALCGFRPHSPQNLIAGALATIVSDELPERVTRKCDADAERGEFIKLQSRPTAREQATRDICAILGTSKRRQYDHARQVRVLLASKRSCAG